MLWDNLDPFLNTGITCAVFNKLGKIPFSKELFLIAEREIEISFLIFFRIDMGMLLGPVHLFELRICVKSDISSGVWCQEEWFCNWVLKVIRKIPLCWWYVFLEFLAYWYKVIIEMFCNIFWLTYSFAVYEKTIRFLCIGFWFTIDYFIVPIPNCFTISFIVFKISLMKKSTDV